LLLAIWYFSLFVSCLLRAIRGVRIPSAPTTLVAAKRALVKSMRFAPARSRLVALDESGE
jgi:hypothetical protein